MKVIGKGKMSGEYQGNKYEKLVFSVEKEVPKNYQNFEGKLTETIFCPYTLENNIPKVGDNIRVYYNKYGKVDAVFVDKNN